MPMLPWMMEQWWLEDPCLRLWLLTMAMMVLADGQFTLNYRMCLCDLDLLAITEMVQ